MDTGHARVKFIKNELLQYNKKVVKIGNTKWEVTIIELKNGKGKRYKVTRRLPELHVSETKIFKSKKKAMEKLQEWLS